MLGLDFSYSRPDPGYVKSQGFSFIARYLSYTPGKNISRREADAALAAGLAVVLVWETYANRPLSGYSGGVADAREAAAQALSVGQPASRPIYFAVDWDASSRELPAIDDYLRGAASVFGAGRVGVYGSYTVVKHCLEAGSAAYGWQTYAWSGGRLYDGSHLYQYSNGEWGGSVDFNRALKPDYGQWPHSERKRDMSLQHPQPAPVDTDGLKWRADWYDCESPGLTEWLMLSFPSAQAPGVDHEDGSPVKVQIFGFRDIGPGRPPQYYLIGTAEVWPGQTLPWRPEGAHQRYKGPVEVDFSRSGPRVSISNTYNP